ncbi:BREX system ATP-binding domain-containing protein [Streptomyces tsukubensis]
MGREDVLSALGGHVNSVAEGSGGCVVVEGPFGTGKTRLLQAMASEGAERGLTVVSGQAGDSERPVPLHPLINLLRRVMPDAVDSGCLMSPDRNPFWLMDRVGELVEQAARRRPLMVVLDDAQRIDDVGGLALRGLVQSLSASPVLWLIAHRPAATRSLARHALGWLLDHAAVRLPLDALDDAATAGLCTSILGAAPDASVLGWADRCGGNPWLVETLFDAFVRSGRIVVVDGTASVLADRLPEGFLTAVGPVLAGVPRPVRQLLAPGGRTGCAFTVEEAATVPGERAPDTVSAVEEAVRTGLLRREGDGLVFAHPVIEEALRHTARQERAPGPSVLPAGTVGTAGTLRAHPSDPPEAAPGGDPVPDGLQGVRLPVPEPVPAAAWLQTTQSAACACDGMVARALPALGDPYDAIPRTLAPVLRLLAGAGRGAEAVRLADIALRPGVEASAEVQLVLELSDGLQHFDHRNMSLGLVRRSAARHDVAGPDRARLNGAIARAAELEDRPAGEHGAPWPARLAGRAPSADRRRGEAAGSGARTTAGKPSPWGVQQTSVPAHCGSCERPLWTWLVRALVAADRFEEATALLEAVGQEAERSGEPWPRSLWHGHDAALLAAGGRLDEAHGRAETALRLADRSAPGDSVPARVSLARLSLHRGDLATASEQLRTAERLGAGEGRADKAPLDWALARFHAASGRPAMAVQTLINVEGQVSPDRLLFTEVPTAAAVVVRLALRSGLTAEAQRAAEFARGIAERNPTVRSLTGGAEHAEGVLRNDMVALHRAADLYRQAARPLAAAGALEDAAEVEQGMGNRTRTVRLLESAADLYLSCGAQHDMDRVQGRLRRLGVQEVSTPGAFRAKTGWESLTDAELRVVRAIVDGRTNREAASLLFLSPHTVDSHLRRVFSKLGINSRVELTKHFISHETLPPVAAASHRPGSTG